MKEYSEIELVQGALNGKAHCEEALYRRFSVPMFRVCLRYAANKTEAQDMLQEGFMRVFADLRHYRGEGSLEGWIRKVIVRASLRWLKKRKAFSTTQLEPEQLNRLAAPAPELEHDGPDSKRVHLLMQRLPAGYRSVLNLYAIEGYRHEEIAQLLDISVGTSRSQLSKARQLLKKMMKESKAVSMTGLG